MKTIAVTEEQNGSFTIQLGGHKSNHKSMKATLEKVGQLMKKEITTILLPDSIFEFIGGTNQPYTYLHEVCESYNYNPILESATGLIGKEKRWCYQCGHEWYKETTPITLLGYPDLCTNCQLTGLAHQTQTP